VTPGIADKQLPDGVRIAIHICRGNNASFWLNEGDYAPIAERLFNTLPVDRFLLEYDALLAQCGKMQTVALLHEHESRLADDVACADYHDIPSLNIDTRHTSTRTNF